MSKYALFIFLFISTSCFTQGSNNAGTPEVYAADSIVWFGADFSQFNLCNQKKIGQDDKLYVYIQAWKEQYDKLANTKLASLLKREKVFNDKAYTDLVYQELKGNQWIYNNEPKDALTASDLQDELNDYESEFEEGIGLVFFVNGFNKKIPSVTGYFVWFDVASKEIIHIYNAQGKPSTQYYNSWGVEVTWDKSLPVSKGMTGYWYQGMVDATLNFTIDFKTAIPRKENKY